MPATSREMLAGVSAFIFRIRYILSVVYPKAAMLVARPMWLAVDVPSYVSSFSLRWHQCDAGPFRSMAGEKRC